MKPVFNFKPSIITLILSLLLTISGGIGQSYSKTRHATGLRLDNEVTPKIPKRAALVTRAYTDVEEIPRRYSLKKYAPSVGNQGGTGTCTAWASAYAARTIADAVANGWTDKAKIDSEAYSAFFLYSLIRDLKYIGCDSGTSIFEAVRAMDSVGVTKKSDVGPAEVCPLPISYRMISNARTHRLGESLTTFFGFSSTSSDKVRKAISQNRPVIIGMKVYDSFDYGIEKSGGIWDGKTAGDPPGDHAMCVVGYDDDFAGGAFEIMNSWGTNWGNKGFVWVRYDDFNAAAKYGVEISALSKADIWKSKSVKLSGSLQFKLDLAPNVSEEHKKMPAVLKNRDGAVPTYKMTKSYKPYQQFRISLLNNEPAYVYVVGSDLINNTHRRFPIDDLTSAALSYSKNEILIPEKESLYFDETEGTNYCVILYSRDELPIDDIVKKIFYGKGEFTKRVKTAVGDSLVVPRNDERLRLEPDKIEFSSTSAGSVVAIVVEIDVR
jgi:hypothetical protein